jgi:hypothetical protein
MITEREKVTKKIMKKKIPRRLIAEMRRRN